MMKKLFAIISVILSFVFTSCEHKELCYNHSHGCPVRVMVDWTNFKQETPTGMTVLAYPSDDKTPYERLSNNTAYTDLFLQKDEYRIMVFNQSIPEFGFVAFQGMDKYETAAVTIVDDTKSWYSKADEAERVGIEPEWFASGVTDEMIEITDEMVFIYGQPHTKDVDDPIVVCNVTPENRIYTLKLKTVIDTIPSLKSIRASLDGMALGCYIHDGSPLSEKATHLMDEGWQKFLDDGSQFKGYAIGEIQCFGLPAGHSAKPEENHLTIHILLKDDSEMKFEFNVGNKFVVDETDPKVLHLTVGDGGEIVLPKLSTGSFDVDVDGWDDTEIIDVPL